MMPKECKKRTIKSCACVPLKGTQYRRNKLEINPTVSGNLASYFKSKIDDLLLSFQ
jgi:hypothetical protein